MTDASTSTTLRPAIHEVDRSPERPTLLTVPFLLLLGAGFGGLLSFDLLLAVVPAYVGSGGSNLAGGLTTGALMASTVATELVMPRILARFGFRASYVVGLLLLGAPAIGLQLSADLPIALVVGLVRGVGLGIVVVTSGAFVAEVAPRARLGEALGVYGAAVSVPAILGLPLGAWLASRVGYGPVFAAAAAAAIVAAVLVIALPAPATVSGESTSMRAALRRPGLARPAAVFLTTTVAAGITVTFLPLALPADLQELVWLALGVQAVGMTAARWAAGRASTPGSGRLLVPAMVIASLGACMLVLDPNAATVVGGMLLFGIGFGMAQTVTLAMMFERASRSEYGVASAVWNLAYDAGLGIGSVGFGAVAQVAGFSVAFGLTAALLVGATVGARRA